MIVKHSNLSRLEVYILFLLSISSYTIGVLSAESSLFRRGLQDSVADEQLGYDALYSRARKTFFQPKNRDGKLPSFPVEPDLRLQSSYISNAHKVLRVALQQFLGFQDTDLGTYLSYLIYKYPEPFVDEYGQVIRAYKKVLRFIWEQHNETLIENYAVGRFNKDKLDLCSVARYLSHQPKFEQRETIMKRMGDALGYRCHPCTPYTPKEFGDTIVPSTDGIDPEGVSPEDSLILCKEIQKQWEGRLRPLSTSTTSQRTITTTVESIMAENSSIDYSPCSLSNGNAVVCDMVPVEEVQKMFKRTSIPILASVNLTLQPYIFNETFIPEDVFGIKKILDIRIEYPLTSCCNNRLRVNADAFRSTISYTNKFTINVIDCTHLDLGFLSGFDKLTELKLWRIYNIQHCLPSLPLLPRLTTLFIAYCTGMNHIHIFPTLKNGLKHFIFWGTVYNIHTIYNDETVDRIMDWLLLSSANTLEEMTIAYMNQVTRVPHKIASFKALRKAWLPYNKISTIKSGAFSFAVPVFELLIHDNGIKEIEPGAFQGDFKDAEVYVHNNNLTQFDESVFGPILKQMASGRGFIGAAFDAGNPIDCSDESICHLAWLQNYEVGVKFWLKCSNGTWFKDLQPGGFNQCQMEHSGNAVSNTDDISPIENLAFDYSPCSYSNGDVVCDKVPLEEVQKAFKRTPFPRLASVKLILQPYIFSETIIPEDVFGTKRILDIWIQYPWDSVVNRSLSLQVDLEAFRSTKNYTNELKMYGIDCTLLDLGFLLGFDKLTKLFFSNVVNSQHCLPSLPSLPLLTTLHFEHFSGMDEFYHFPVLTKGLRDFRFQNDDITKFHSNKIINDKTVDRIMDWLLLSSSNTLEEMAITFMNQVTRVPSKIASFKALRKLWFHDNNISIIKSEAFSFSVPVFELDIHGNGIKEIEPGAFHGDFKDAAVYVYNNNLTRFEESMFGSILQQMASGNGFIGGTYDAGNPIDCSDGSICHLAWLRHYQVDVKFSLKCFNGTSFKDLLPVDFNHCS